MTEREPISLEQWKEFVFLNCGDSYSFIVCQAILILWEAQVTTLEEAEQVLRTEKMGLSGAQAETAKSMALQRLPSGWLLKDMLDIRIDQKATTK